MFITNSFFVLLIVTLENYIHEYFAISKTVFQKIGGTPTSNDTVMVADYTAFNVSSEFGYF